ncbi:hypothetical protein MT349_08475 [Rathayibacter caricis]|uniref:hypothetical protein n=1 Tax=Rathayibacter caricis TaxID=110936 RepID=UPI001FB5156B|nr:hypothetical protein [Rathayibacter caricis]MCJ1695817.1 hypothetical protein [Rathayibacter caricis]
MTVTVTAHRWVHGWELRIDGETGTQVDSLDRAAQQVRDYLDTVEPGTDHRRWEVEIDAASSDVESSGSVSHSVDG